MVQEDSCPLLSSTTMAADVAEEQNGEDVLISDETVQNGDSWTTQSQILDVLKWCETNGITLSSKVLFTLSLLNHISWSRDLNS